MSPITRARGRPRVRSVNFHVLWWLCAREAAFEAIYQEYRGSRLEAAARFRVLTSRADHLRRVAERALRFRAYPAWHFRPPLLPPRFYTLDPDRVPARFARDPQ